MVVSSSYPKCLSFVCLFVVSLIPRSASGKALIASVEKGKTIFEQLARDDRAFVVLTLLTLVLVVIVLTFVIIVGGRWARRRVQWRRGPTTFGGSASTERGERSATDLPIGNDMDAIGSAETMIDDGNEDTRQSE